MKRSYLIAAGLALACGAWIASGLVETDIRSGEPDPVSGSLSASAPQATKALVKVRVRTSVAETRLNEAVLMGRTQANRRASLRAETEGRIEMIGVERGAHVKAGAIIARIAMDAREARLKEVQAVLAQRELEFEAAQKLARQEFRSRTGLAAARAELEAARAQLKRTEVDIRNTTIRAPFGGVLEARPVETGNYVERGDQVGTIVDLDPILVIASLPETKIGRVRLGVVGEAALVTGARVRGVVSYVATTAEAGTRTYRVEMELQNPERAIVEGLTATVSLPLDTMQVHRVPPSALSLSDSGKVGVKIVNEANRVDFLPVRIVGQAEDGIWLGGLPERVRLITVGHEYVVGGELVTPMAEPSASAIAEAEGKS